ncbi:beta-ketoacyl synthase chain length factor [Micromonospora sp. WMMD961]|uniref:beta-ketoacyl synthase chain length factor n=1 Tax=Micromonospora sp. WMMD961 TaxID=3016100 RepID=UPI002415F13F|nr:beta-ketoacyl synthase chain length factor [Micromonospora sp. WMMD961]MDG4781596.1 beta-ketoacyl synthase chain length factor [Micromonospora sp. WMMD961]
MSGSRTEPGVVARARWPEAGDDEQAPGVPGFVCSQFAPVAVAVAERCLRRGYGSAGVPAGVRTGIVLVSASGDLVSAEHVRATVEAGGRVGPLFFFQSVPNSVVGHIAARWGLRGPVVCLSPTGDPYTDGTAEADLLRDDGDADEVLLILIEQAPDAPTEAVAVLLGGEGRP